MPNSYGTRTNSIFIEKSRPAVGLSGLGAQKMGVTQGWEGWTRGGPYRQVEDGVLW